VEAPTPTSLDFLLSDPRVLIFAPAQGGEVEEHMKLEEGLSYANPHWIFAGERNHGEGFVYRSVLVADDDPEYLAVKQRFDGFTVTHREVIEDEQMMFGHGELTIFGKV
jgi:hypothetical protein